MIGGNQIPLDDVESVSNDECSANEPTIKIPIFGIRGLRPIVSKSVQFHAMFPRPLKPGILKKGEDLEITYQHKDFDRGIPKGCGPLRHLEISLKSPKVSCNLMCTKGVDSPSPLTYHARRLVAMTNEFGVDGLNARRLGVLEFWKERARVLESSRTSESSFHVPLIREMALAAGIECDDTLGKLVSGFPMTGDLGFSGYSLPLKAKFIGRVSVPFDECTIEMNEAFDWFSNRYQPPSEGECKILIDLTKDDVDKGSIVGPLSLEELKAKFPKGRICLRFGVRQSQKIRPCDDLTENLLNPFAVPQETCRFDGIHDYLSMIQVLRDAGFHDLKGWQEYIEYAYRLLPIVENEQSVAVFALFHPDLNE